MNRRTLLKLLATAPIASHAPFLWAAESQERTVYGPPVMPTMLLGIAARNGILQKTHPFKVKVWRNPDQLRAGLTRKRINMTIVPSYVAANLATQGQDVKLVNIMTFGLLQVVGRGEKLSSIQDLVGKKIVIPFKNDMPDLLLQVLCRKEGIDFSSLNAIYTSTPPEAVMLLMKGRVDYALVPEPLATMATLKGKQMGQKIDRLLDLQKEWGRVMQTPARIAQAGLLVSSEILEKHKSTVQMLQKDLESAVSWAQENPRAAAVIAASYLPAPTPALEMAIPYSQLSAEPAENIADEILFFFRQLYELNPKIVGGKMPDKSLFAAIE